MIDKTLNELFDTLRNGGEIPRESAALALENRGEEALPGLLDALAEAKHPARHRIVKALGKIGHPRAVPTLSRLIEAGGDPIIREMAAFVLGEIGDSSAIPALMTALNKDMPFRVRAAAAESLKKVKVESETAPPETYKVIEERAASTGIIAWGVGAFAVVGVVLCGAVVMCVGMFLIFSEAMQSPEPQLVVTRPPLITVRTQAEYGTARLCPDTAPVQRLDDARVFEGHQRSIHTVVWSPDGTLLASGSIDGEVIIWDAESGDILQNLTDAEGYVEGLAFSPDGSRIAAAAMGAEVLVWEVDSGRLVTRLGSRRYHSGHANFLMVGVSWSPDGESIIAGSAGGALVVWDVESGVSAGMPESRERPIRDVAWSPEGSWIASGNIDGVVSIWDGETYERVAILDGGIIGIESLYWHDEGLLLTSIAEDGSMRIWDIAEGYEVRGLGLSAGSDWLTGTGWSSDGLVAMGLSDGSISLHASDNGACQAVLHGHSEAVRDIAWSPERGQFASVGSDGLVILWPALEQDE